MQNCVFIFPLWVSKKEKYQNYILSSLILCFFFPTQHQQVLTRKNESGTVFLSVRIFFPTKKKMFFPRHFLSPQNIYKRGFFAARTLPVFIKKLLTLRARFATKLDSAKIFPLSIQKIFYASHHKNKIFFEKKKLYSETKCTYI